MRIICLQKEDDTQYTSMLLFGSTYYRKWQVFYNLFRQLVTFDLLSFYGLPISEFALQLCFLLYFCVGKVMGEIIISAH